MKNFHFLFICFVLGILSSCIKDDFVDDFVDPILRINSTIDTLQLNSTFQFESTYLNNIGQEEIVFVQWQSNAPEIITIDESGLASAISEGDASITATYSTEGDTLTDTVDIVVGQNTVISNLSTSGTIQTTSSYELTGSFEYSETATGVILEVGEDYKASTALPGLYLYLSNNKSSISNALEIGKVEVFEGAHTYEINNVAFNDFQYILYFCKPFNVKVGDATL